MTKTIFSSLAALVRKILFCYSKIKFISSRHRVISIYFCKCQKADEKRKSKEDEQTLEELNVAHRRSQTKCHSVRTSLYIKRIKLLLFLPCNKHIINELSRSVWENLDLGRVYKPHCARFLLTTSIKILPYRPPARLIRAEHGKF